VVPTREIAVVGAGPTAASLVERLLANAADLAPDEHVRIHLVDPHRRGLGRVWRPDQHPGLWMNSMAEDVTMFTDDSVRCAGPIRPGPSLAEWAGTIDDETLTRIAPPAVAAEIRSLDGATFPTRLVQSAYLEWFLERVLATTPLGVEVRDHVASAVDVTDEPDGRQRVSLTTGADLVVDRVVLALGHLDSDPPDRGALQRRARRHGLVHIPAGHTAEQDLSCLRPGADVIALGFGQAFTDLVVLLTEARGGTFVERADGSLRYEPSGEEPVIHVGSRRGVPYRAKLDYRLQAPLAPLPMFFDRATIDELLRAAEPIEFQRDLYPLVAKEVGWAYYHELFHAHGERVTGSWDEFATRYTAAAFGPELDAVVADHVPATADRFDIPSIDRPLADHHFGSRDELHDWVATHVASDIARRTDPTFSADLGAFMGLLLNFGMLGRVSGSGRMSHRSRVRELGSRWFSFFMYYASGPPPARLRQLLALAEAGLIRFIGADTTVVLDEELGRFVARSTSHADVVVADAYVDARIAPVAISRSPDRLVRALQDRGDSVEEVLTEGEWIANTGKVVTDQEMRVVRADGSTHPQRFAVGTFTNRPAAGAFARPRTNAPSFRQNDAVARALLDGLTPPATPAAASDP
jgi:uncharacterized NAD(P)/FAD-binding protein YdhS